MQVSSHMQYNYDMSKDAKEPTGLGTCGPQASEQVAEKEDGRPKLLRKKKGGETSG